MAESPTQAETGIPVPTPQNDRFHLKLLESQPVEAQSNHAREMFLGFLKSAAQPRHASGNACIKLCYFVEQCRTSKAPVIQETALSEITCLDLFNFYIEWSEKNQNRSMRQVLDLITSLIMGNPNGETARLIKDRILKRILSILSHQTAQRWVKPAFKSLECFVSKRTLPLEDLIVSYQDLSDGAEPDLSSDAVIRHYSAWDTFFTNIFDWMTFPDVSPAAGKFLVTAFQELRTYPVSISGGDHTTLWQRWIRNGLTKHPQALENVKNYLFPSLFKLDRVGSLAFLEDLNKYRPVSEMQNERLDTQSLLQLAAMDVGKKAGLIEEPSTIHFQKPLGKSVGVVILQEDTIEPLLAHVSNTVRSLAFSVLVSSSSSIRPFSSKALQILRSYMGILYCDTDAKFRNEILSSTKHMIGRLRGATASLVRESESLSARLHRQLSSERDEYQNRQQLLKSINELLCIHSNFLDWYLEFLLGELIPTASYQRHIMALRATILLLSSGILKGNSALYPVPVPSSASVWPFPITLFTPTSIRLLLDLVMDPFEDVRSSATEILKFATSDKIDTPLSNMFLENIQVSHELEEAVSPKSSQLILRQTSESAVTSSGTGLLGLSSLLVKFIDRAEDLSKRTGRADYADGLGRAYELLYSHLGSTEARIQLFARLVESLESKVRVAEDNLGHAVLAAPLHGTLASLKSKSGEFSFLWEVAGRAEDLDTYIPEQKIIFHNQLDGLCLRIVQSCRRIWALVREVLCNDSPEGHFPQDLDINDIIDTKDILSYSFRAILESSNLMRTILGKIKHTEVRSQVSPTQLFTLIGELTFEQISNLRHRGAFSAVSLTFAKCCQLTQTQLFTVSSEIDLLQTWYNDALCCILEQTSTTRRSAGIPAIFTGIMSANSNSPPFGKVMTDLMLLARQDVADSGIDETNLPQVHALNCLKEVFKVTTLGKQAEPYMAESFKIAVKSLYSKRWAIRNSGLILLRSLIDRLFGTNESKDVIKVGWDGGSTKISYESYPELPELLLELLKDDTDGIYTLDQPRFGNVELVLPALDIIRRAGPPPTYRVEICEGVAQHLGSRVWHIREMAAHTMCSLVSNEDWVNTVTNLLRVTTTSVPNHRHGLLLAVKNIIARRLRLDPAPDTSDIINLMKIWHNTGKAEIHRRSSPIICAAHLDIQNTFLFHMFNNPATTFVQIFGEASLFFSAIEDPYERFLWLFNNEPSSQSLSSSIVTQQSQTEKQMTASQWTGWALYCNAVAESTIYHTNFNEDHTSLQNILKYVVGLNHDVAFTALETIPRAWTSNSHETTAKLCEAYICACAAAKSNSIYYAALLGLTTFLEQRFDPCARDSGLVISALKPLCSLSKPDSERATPSQTHIDTVTSGWVFLCQYLSLSSDALLLSTFPMYIRAWKGVIKVCGNAQKDYESRLAAVSALAAFYKNIISNRIPDQAYFAPSLFALYDALNDDEEEIRSLAAQTFCAMARRHMPPLTALVARNEFAKLLGEEGSLQIVILNIIRRLTGSKEIGTDAELTPLVRPRGLGIGLGEENDQEQGNTLFAEEKQNLFIDEVRELQLWREVFSNLPKRKHDVESLEPYQSRPILEFLKWVSDAVDILSQINIMDGPLGWSSKPQAFETTIQIIHCASAILDFHDSYFETSIYLDSMYHGEDIVWEEILIGMERSYGSQCVIWFKTINRISLHLKAFALKASKSNLHPRLLSAMRAKELKS